MYIYIYIYSMHACFLETSCLYKSCKEKKLIVIKIRGNYHEQIKLFEADTTLPFKELLKKEMRKDTKKHSVYNFFGTRLSL